MMTLEIRLIIIALLLIGLIFIINMIKKRKLELQYVITWIFLDLGLFLIVVIPGFLNWITKICGVYDATNMVFFLGFLFSIMLIFNITKTVSKNSERERKLAQRMALAEYENKRFRKIEEVNNGNN